VASFRGAFLLHLLVSVRRQVGARAVRQPDVTLAKAGGTSVGTTSEPYGCTTAALIRSEPKRLSSK